NRCAAVLRTLEWCAWSDRRPAAGPSPAETGSWSSLSSQCMTECLLRILHEQPVAGCKGHAGGNVDGAEGRLPQRHRDPVPLGKGDLALAVQRDRARSDGQRGRRIEVQGLDAGNADVLDQSRSNRRCNAELSVRRIIEYQPAAEGRTALDRRDQSDDGGQADAARLGEG